MSVEYYSALTTRFARIIADEGHKTKNPRTRIAEVLRQLKCPAKWLLTATPMLNRASDYYGYLLYFWNEEWDIDEAEENSGAFEFDRYNDAHVPQHTATYLPGGELEYGKVGMALWRLNPDLYHSYMSEQDADIRCLKAYKALRSVIPIVMLHRTQATIIEVNGNFIRIGDLIPKYHICTVELQWANKRAEQEYLQYYQPSIEFLRSGAQEKSKPFYIQSGKGTGKAIKGGNAGTRSFAVHRKLGMLTLNPALYHMLLATGRRNMVQHVEKWYDTFKDQGMSLYFEFTKPAANLPIYADRASFLEYLCKDSPKLQYLVKLCGEICLDVQDPRRVLIFTDWPINQWMISGVLKVSTQTKVWPCPPPPQTLVSLLRPTRTDLAVLECRV